MVMGLVLEVVVHSCDDTSTSDLRVEVGIVLLPLLCSWARKHCGVVALVASATTTTWGIPLWW